MRKRIVLALAASIALAGLSDRAGAATAHNSQAGAYGHTKNDCEPTPGFPYDGGCLPGVIEDDVDGPPGPAYKRDRYRPVPPPPVMLR